MNTLRYPAIPLITVDPHFSIWSCEDHLYDDVTRHWTGRRHNMFGMLHIDGVGYRFMGKLNADNRNNREPLCLSQTGVQVLPMRTVYTFENSMVRLALTFMTPLLTDDLKLLSRPVSYISYDIEVLDGKEHQAKLYFELDCEIAVNTPEQQVTAEIYENGIRCGRGDQDILVPTALLGEIEKGGDNRNIDWGWLHLFSKDGFEPKIRTLHQLHGEFKSGGSPSYLNYQPQEIQPGEAFSLNDKVVYIGLEKEMILGKDVTTGFICAAYDDIHSIKYFGKMIDAYYKKDGDSFEDICQKALVEYPDICRRVEQAEKNLLEKANAISTKYADIISLAYRQVIAAHKLTWDGEELQFLSKECYSNGCIATLDVTYPSIPQFLLLEPTLIEGMLNPLFKYASSGKWPFDFAPHDVGQYPFVSGQAYWVTETGEQQLEGQMPVEESGNAILCVYGICHYKNDNSYFIKHKSLLETWVKYLLKFGLDPENQLCTDDFAGHLAHNCNLSVKAIMGIAAYGKLLERIGDPEAEFYLQKAKEYARNWEETAFDKDHYRLAFDKENTWSIKYNMVWDQIYGWGIFSDEVFDQEINYYLKQFKAYGLPLDCRSDYTKTDWMMWSARLGDNKEYRNRIVSTMWDMLNETPDRVPFTDWYYASTSYQKEFQNRTVQGGLFILMI